MNILIIGATRGIGKYLTELALENGHNVKAMARKPGFENLENNILTKITGSITYKEIVKNVTSKTLLYITSLTC